MWFRAVVLFCFVAVTMGAVARGRLNVKPDKYADKEGCYIPELDDVIPYGETAPSKKSCMQYTCHSDEIEYESCGAVGAPGLGIKVVEDKSKPYPECCKRLVRA